ncbi:MAG: sensor domain-containing diguanylate cyclase [Candidatus Hydrogenedentes bacterium]|nr:sensor domain-containing diguanylate cyclase [Candidatus Hydrogenedentota bacterium]
MNEASATSLLEQFELLSSLDTAASRDIVPLHDHCLFLELVAQAIGVLEEGDLSDLSVVVDTHTALQVEGFDKFLQRAKGATFIGPIPERWMNDAHVSSFPLSLPPKTAEHLFLVISPGTHLAVLGQAKAWSGQDTPTYTGGWVFRRLAVHRIARHILGANTPPAGEDREDVTAALAAALMRCHAAVLETLQRDMAMDKNDLFSVLNILKAISAKRRAHDVLFVFVEQIARVVSAERCSIVRVWGSDETGQVLASHEDATVNHRTIQMDKYPELRAALATHEKIVVSDVRTHPLTHDLAEVLGQAQIRALLVIPIVLFDETIGSLFLRAARKSGTFTVREISFFEVVAEAAANALERAHLFESIQIANERLERLAITDGLTGLYNHRYCRDRLEEEFQRAIRYRLPLSCMIFDVDNFKHFNDTYGHLLGDSILREISERTLTCVRKSDLVARYGGEEFIVIMPQTDSAGGFAEAERLRRAIASRLFRDVPEDVQVTVSVGVGTLDQEQMQNYDDIIRAADIALYEAKRTGKNKVAAFSGALTPIVTAAPAPRRKRRR